ncbi:plasmid stabilization protein [Labrys neptuniae]
MTEPRLFIRSAKARDLARRLATREKRTVVDIVERALEAYEAEAIRREPAATFYVRLTDEASADVDLEHMIRRGRRPHSGIEY